MTPIQAAAPLVGGTGFAFAGFFLGFSVIGELYKINCGRVFMTARPVTVNRLRVFMTARPVTVNRPRVSMTARPVTVNRLRVSMTARPVTVNRLRVFMTARPVTVNRLRVFMTACPPMSPPGSGAVRGTSSGSCACAAGRRSTSTS